MGGTYWRGENSTTDYNLQDLNRETDHRLQDLNRELRTCRPLKPRTEDWKTCKTSKRSKTVIKRSVELLAQAAAPGGPRGPADDGKRLDEVRCDRFLNLFKKGSGVQGEGWARRWV